MSWCSHLHCHITLLQQQGDGDGLHRRHPFEAHLGNKALRALRMIVTLQRKKAAIHVKNRACSEYGSMELSYLVIFQCTCLLYIDMFVFLSYNFRLYILELRTIYNPFPVYKKSSTPKHRGCRLRHLQRRPISRSRHGEEAVKSNRRKS